MVAVCNGFRAALPLAVAVLAGGWAVVSASAQETPLRVVATVGMIGDIAAGVGGECAAVETMMGPGIDPHLYRAQASDVRLLQDADIILYSGYSLEGQLADVLERLARTKPTVAVVEAAVPPASGIAVEGGGIDPHLWMDAGLWAGIVPVIAGELSALRPDCAEAIGASAARIETELAALHEWIGAAVATIPDGQRILVTAHDAFGYYGRAYGIEVEGLQGISTEAEAGIADIRATAELVAERGVPAIFVESTINPRTVQAVVDAARVGGHEVAVGAQLFSDAMGEAGTAGGTYVGMLHANTAAIVPALGGSVPPLPDALGEWASRWGIDAGAPESAE